MKRLGHLLIAVSLLFCTTAQADGIDIKAKGTWDFAFGWAVNSNFKNNRNGYRDNDHFLARHRVRTQINFITSESLQGVLMFEIGNLEWGRGGKNGPGSGSNLDADGVNVETKRAYLDWMIPDSPVSVRMGIQGLSLPMANGYCNPVFSADVAGIVINSPITDMLGVTAFWARPFDASNNDGTDGFGRARHLNDEMDVFGLVLPVTGDGWSVTPWGVYAHIGNASGYYDYILGYNSGAADNASWGSSDRSLNKSASAWWAGVSVEVSLFDPLTFGFDAMYGRLSKTDMSFNDGAGNTYDRAVSTRGWFVEAALNYRLDWGVPGIFGWYASGDDEDDVDGGKLGRMPVVGVDDGFAPTSFGFVGTYSIGTDSVVSVTGVGTWGIGVQIADMSFIEDLSHTLRFAYYRGTNDNELVKGERFGTNATPRVGVEPVYLTDKDAVFEVNFDHKYKIYENLTAIVETGYINLNLDKDTWRNHKTDDAWKAQVLLRYQF